MLSAPVPSCDHVLSGGVEVTVIERRLFLSGAAMMGAGAAGSVRAATVPDREGGTLDDAAELRDIGKELRQTRETWIGMLSGDVEGIREQQRVYLKSTGRYPDYIDVGLAVWERIYDWHVRWQQPITLTRLPDNLYGMAYMLTTLVLRPNMQATYIGPGYDSK
jgi:hypothetical protein